jgi:hypothetical protein
MSDDEATAQPLQLQEATLRADSTISGEQLTQYISRVVLADEPGLSHMDVGAVQKIAQQLMSEVENSPEWAGVWATLQQMARDNSVNGILARQQVRMAAIAVRNRRDVPTSRELYEAEAALRCRLPTTPEQAAEVEQAALDLTADPEKRKVIEWVSAAFRYVDVAGLTPWGFVVLAMWLLLRVASEPGEQSSNDLAVIAIVIAAVAVIRPKD